MKPEYWRERWRAGHIGFHRSEPNPRLTCNHQRALAGAERVLVPLCGKSLDLEWLAGQGHQVVGVELSELAVESFFSEHGLQPTRRELPGFIEYAHQNLSILVGDFFELARSGVEPFDGAYDRAAMIALPEDLRARYVACLRSVLARPARLLLITLHYDAAGGPPFSVSPKEVAQQYSAARITELESVDARSETPGPVSRGASFVHENAYLIELPGGAP